MSDYSHPRICALVIGHTKKSPGAINPFSSLAEFDFNDELSRKIEEKVVSTNVQRIYRKTYRQLPDDINSIEPDFVIELHCNSLNTMTSGTEVLYFHKSEIGKKMASILLHHLVAFLCLTNRGIKPTTVRNRGGHLLKNTTAPTVISEPFFIDNDTDLAGAMGNIDGLADAYARAIDEISLLFSRAVHTA